MNDAFFVRGFESFSNLLRNGESFFDWNRAVALDALGSVSPGTNSMTR